MSTKGGNNATGRGSPSRRRDAAACRAGEAADTATACAQHYWKLPEAATLRDVVLVVRADEAHHRDVNHGFANTLSGLPEEREAAPYPPHAQDIRYEKSH